MRLPWLGQRGRPVAGYHCRTRHDVGWGSADGALYSVRRSQQGAPVGPSVATIFGSTPQRPQVTALHNRVDIIVACRGRLT